eukprot:g82.t1
MPAQSEEEQESTKIPSSQLCNSCLAVTYHIDEALTKAHGLRPASKSDEPLSELAFLEAIEDACGAHRYDSYSLGSKNGKSQLQGKGIPFMEHVMGVSMGGGRWQSRMVDMCKSMTGDSTWEDGEEEFYSRMYYPVFNDLNRVFAKEMCVTKMKYCTKKEYGVKTRKNDKSGKPLKKKKKKKSKKRKRTKAKKDRKEKPEL